MKSGYFTTMRKERDGGASRMNHQPHQRPGQYRARDVVYMMGLEGNPLLCASSIKLDD